jgi:hypothetical protein
MGEQRRAAARVKKRPYRAPKLKRHGDLRTLTQAKGGDRGDGNGVPKTRTTTGP